MALRFALGLSIPQLAYRTLKAPTGLLKHARHTNTLAFKEHGQTL